MVFNNVLKKLLGFPHLDFHSKFLYLLLVFMILLNVKNMVINQKDGMGCTKK